MTRELWAPLRATSTSASSAACSHFGRLALVVATLAVAVSFTCAVPNTLSPLRQVADFGRTTLRYGRGFQSGNAVGNGTAAMLNKPYGMTVTAAGDLLIADRYNNNIRVVPADTDSVRSFAVSSCSAGATAILGYPTALLIHPLLPDIIFMADSGRIARISLQASTIDLFAGQCGNPGYHEGPVFDSQFSAVIVQIAYDGTSSTLFVADTQNNVVRKIFQQDTKLVSGSHEHAGVVDGAGPGARHHLPCGCVFGATTATSRTLIVSEHYGHVLRSIDLATAQVTTIAGQAYAVGHRDGAAVDALFYNPAGLASDFNMTQSIYIADLSNHVVRRLTQGSTPWVTTIVGDGKKAFTNSGTSHLASIANPVSLFIDGATARLYISGESGIVTVDLALTSGAIPPTSESIGIVSVLAGSGTSSYADGPAASAAFNTPRGLLVSPLDDNVILIADAQNRVIRQLDLGSMRVTTTVGIAGNSVAEDGVGTAAQASVPRCFVSHPEQPNVVFFTDLGTVRRIDLSSVTVSTFSGSLALDVGHKDGPAAQSQFDEPHQMVIEILRRTIYVTDTNNHRIRTVNIDTGASGTAAGDGSIATVDGGGIGASFAGPYGLAFATSTITIVSDRDGHGLRTFDMDTLQVTTLTSPTAFGAYRDGPVAQSQFSLPQQLVTDPAGRFVFIADSGNNVVRRLDFFAGWVTSVMGPGSGGTAVLAGSPDSTLATVQRPSGLAFSCRGGSLTLYVTGNHGVVAIAITSALDQLMNRNCTPLSLDIGAVTLAAGSATPGSTDDVSWSSARFNGPAGMTMLHRLDRDAVLVADKGNHVIRSIDFAVGVSTFTGTIGNAGDDTTHLRAPAAIISLPQDPPDTFMILTSVGVRKLVAGEITAYCGTSANGYLEGEPSVAQFNSAQGFDYHPVSFDLLVADTNNYRIRGISATTRSSQLIAGQEAPGAIDGTALIAAFGGPTGVVYDKDGTRAIIADTSNHLLREIVFGPTTTVRTLAGSIIGGFADGPLSAAKFSAPSGLNYDPSYSYLYVADRDNHRVRRVDLAAGRVVTVVGNGRSINQQVSVSHEASVSYPQAVAITCTWSGMTLFVSGMHQVTRVAMSNDGGCASQTPAAYDIGRLERLTGSTTPGSGGETFGDAAYQDPTGMASVADGTLLLIENMNVRRLNLPEALVFDWLGMSGVSGADDGTGTSARLSSATSTERSLSDDNVLYLADGTRVRQISISQVSITAFCGSIFSDLVDGACAEARFQAIRGLAIDPYSLDFYLTDTNVIRTIAIRDAVPTLASPCGRAQSGNVDGVGNAAQFNMPDGIAVWQPQTRLLVADVANHCLREVDLATFTTSSATPCGTSGYVDGTFRQVRFSRPRDVRRSLGANSPYFFVTDSDNARVRRVDITGRRVTTVVGTGHTQMFVNSPTSITASIRSPSKLVLACYLGNQYLFISAPHAVVQVTLNAASTSGSNVCHPTSVNIGRAGYPLGQLTSTNAAADGIGRDASFAEPSAVLVSRLDPRVLYVADHRNYAIRRIDTTTLQVTTFLGVLGIRAVGNPSLFEPTFLLHSPLIPGVIYFCDAVRIRSFVESNGTVTDIAGQASSGMSDGLNSAAQFLVPSGLEVHEGSELLYVCDSGNHRIRVVGGSSTSTLSGRGSLGRFDGPGAEAMYNTPTGIVIHAQSNYSWVTDRGSGSIRQVNTLTGHVTTIGGYYGAGKLDGALSTARFREPMHLRLDFKRAYVYVADMGNHAVRRIHIAGLFVQTVFGSGRDAFVASTSSLNAAIASPTDVTFACNDGTPRLYVTGINGVASVQLDNVAEEEGTVDWCAPYSTNIGRVFPAAIGSSLPGFADSPQPTFRGPQGLLISPADSNVLIVADTNNTAIRLVYLDTNTVSTLAGTNISGTADGDGEAARFTSPSLLVLHPSNADYVIVADKIAVRLLKLSEAHVATYAGQATSGYLEASPATSAFFSKIAGMDIQAVTYDIFVSDSTMFLRVVRWNAGHTFTERVSGSDSASHADGNGASASHDHPTGVLVMLLYSVVWVADTGSHTLRSVSLDNRKVTTIGGDPYDNRHRDGPLANARFAFPTSLTTRPTRDYVYLVSQGNLASIRRIRLPSLLVDTVLGGTGFGPTVPTPRSIDAVMSNTGAAHLAAGCFLGSPTLFISTEHSISAVTLNGVASDEERTVCTAREIDIGPVRLIAGSTVSGDVEGIGTSATFQNPQVATKSRLVNGKIIVTDVSNSVFRLVDEATSQTATWIGVKGVDTAVDGTEQTATVAYPTDLVDDPDPAFDVLFFTHAYGVSQISCSAPSPCNVNIIVGSLSHSGYAEGNGPNARFSSVHGIDMDPGPRTLYVADTENHRLRGVRETATGGYGSFLVTGSGAATTVDGVGALANHHAPIAVAIVPSSATAGMPSFAELWTTDRDSHCVRVVDLTTHRVTSPSSTREPGFRDGPLRTALFVFPYFLKPDHRKIHLYLGEDGNRRIRRIHLPSRFVATVVGGDRAGAGTFAGAHSSLLARVHAFSATPACRSSDGKPVLYLAGRHAVMEVEVDSPAGGFDCAHVSVSATHQNRASLSRRTMTTARSTTSSLPSPSRTASRSRSLAATPISRLVVSRTRQTPRPPLLPRSSSTPTISMSKGVVTRSLTTSHTLPVIRSPRRRPWSTPTTDAPATATATASTSSQHTASPTRHASVSVSRSESETVTCSPSLLPPVPAVVAVPYTTPTVARTADYTATGTTVVLGVMSPSVASLAGRQSALRGLLSCAAREEAQSLHDVEPPGRDTNVLQLAVSVSGGQSAALDLRAGAIVMCAIELVAVAILGALIAAGRFAVHAPKTTGHYKTTGARWLGSLAWSRFPGTLAFVYAYTSGIATQSATVLLTNGSEPTAVAMLVGLASFIVVVPWAAAVALFARRFRRTFTPAISKRTQTDARRSSSMFVRTYRWWLEPTCEWEPSAELMSMQDTKRGYNLQRHFGLVFDPYNSRAPWFVILEVLLLNVVAGVASQLASAAGCAWATWLTFAVYVVHIAAMAWFRPYSVRLEALGQTVVVTSQCLAVMLAGAKSEGAEGTLDSASSVAEAIATVAAFVLMLLPLLSVYHTIRSFVRQRVELVARTSYAERLLAMPETDDIPAPALGTSDFPPDSTGGLSVDPASTAAIPRRSQFRTVTAPNDASPDLDALLGALDEKALPDTTASAGLMRRDQYGAVLNLATTGGRTTVNPLLIRTPAVQMTPTLGEDLDALLGP
jgi:DNA-binding beta-propeller fold protein YncE